MSDIIKLTDEEIVEKVRSSDSELYAILIERYKNKLLRYATNLVHDQSKASHIVQDAFIKAYVNLNGFNTQKKFSSWFQYGTKSLIKLNEIFFTGLSLF